MNQATLAARSHAFPFGRVRQSQGFFALDGGPRDLRNSFRIFAAVRHARHGHFPATPVTLMGRADLVHHVAMDLPDVSERIAEDDFGILHLEMGAMKLATRDAIERYELHTVRRHFAFIAYLFEHADDELYGAILVSYLEPLFIDAGAPEYEHARSLLPPNLAEALRRAELRYTLLANTWSAAQPRRVPDAISLTLY
jgi:hypothetical protein